MRAVTGLTKRHIAAIFAAATVLASLAGCGPGKGAMQQAHAELAVEPFGIATRERLDSDSDSGGPTFRTTVQAHVAATWAEAEAAVHAEFKSRCPDGELWDGVSRSPEITAEPGDPEFPAGTTFTRIYRCHGPLPGEIALAVDTPLDAAITEIRELMHWNGDVTDRRFIVVEVDFDDDRPKYAAIKDTIGYRMLAAHSKCAGAPVELRQLVIGNWPRNSDPRRPLNPQQLIVGTEIVCLPSPGGQ